MIQSSGNFVRMLILIISRPGLKVGHVRSKTRSRSNLKLGHVGLKTRLLGQQATQVSDLGQLWPSCFHSPNVNSDWLSCIKSTLTKICRPDIWQSQQHYHLKSVNFFV